MVVLEVLLRLAATQPKLQQQVLLPSWILRDGDSVLSLVGWLLLSFSLTEPVLLEVILIGTSFHCKASEHLWRIEAAAYKAMEITCFQNPNFANFSLFAPHL
jgi:hypothetical protein